MRKKRIAILGYSFRLPGTTRDRFWPDLLAGKNFISQVPADRWALDTYSHPRKNHPGTSYTFAAGSLGDIFSFDADFFGISPREAAQMDPQQRLLLEIAWEAFENAGIRPNDIRGSACGVYIGLSTTDYSFRFADDLAAIDSSVATGSTASIAANRISYAFDLRGPSVTLDTACSSSLVAFHHACCSVASGESVLALAGGVNLHLHPYAFVAFSKASMLSRQGACKVFDAAADGYVRSEGGGVFVLKDYDRALADGDPILAVVASSAVNTDGRKSGLTVPSVQAQVALMTQACTDAGIAPSEIDYIEAHGTGTGVGDPVETHAIGDALARFRGKKDPLLIGSVKSNLGHLEAASGAAGLIKALLCLENRTVPATIHFDNPNPGIRFGEWNLRVATQPTPLKSDGKLFIGVNSFGFGGANAHVLLQSADAPLHQGPGDISGMLPVVVSGKNKAALKSAARDLAAFARNSNGTTLYDIAWTTIHLREWHEERALVFSADTDTLSTALEQFADEVQPAAPGLEAGAALKSPVKIGFLYSGNGSQWEGMGRRLMAEEPVFREAVLRVDAIFRPLAGYSLTDELDGKNGAGRYEFTEIAQPALFALQVGLTELLRRWGIAPAAVAGHSVGEIAAAWACGGLSLDDAVRVIYHRSRLQGTTKGNGRMTAAGLKENAARALIEELGLGARLSIAGINSASSVTVAGGVDALDALEAALEGHNVFYRRLDLDYAFHSPAMDKIETGIRRALAPLNGLHSLSEEPSGSFFSGVEGRVLNGTALDADYWWRNIREPVQFEKVLRGMLDRGINLLVEIGPHALLRSYVNSVMADAGVDGRYVATMLRGDDSPTRVLRAIGQVGILGGAVDWSAALPSRGRLVRMPNYPWQRECYRHTPSAESDERLNRSREHPLLGCRLRGAEWAWQNTIDLALSPTLADHVIGDATVMPGTGYAEMALAAARSWHGGSVVEIEQLEIHAPLILSDAHSKVLRFAIDAADGSFAIQSREHMTDGPWTVHAAGRIPREPSDILMHQMSLALPSRRPDFTGADHDALTRAVGLTYGPAFRALEAIWRENGSAIARLRVPEAIRSELDSLHLHPALLDCTFQMIIQLLKDDYIARSGTVYVPSKIDRLIFRCGRTIPHMAQATLLRRSAHSLTATFTLYDANGEPVAWIPEARFQSIRLHKNPAERLRYLQYHVVPGPHPLRPATAPRMLFGRLRQSMGEFARAASGRGALKRYTGEIEPLLDSLCSRYAARALQALSSDDQVLSESDVRACAESHPATAPLLMHLVAMLEQDGALEAVGTDWRFIPDADLPSPEDIWCSLITEHPDYLPIIHGVGRVGMHLAPLIRGALALEEVLPRDCTPGGICQLLNVAGLGALEQVLQQFAVQTLAELAPGRRFRILELGAGRPSFAAHLCKAIDFDRCDYIFATTAAGAASEECHSLREHFPRVAIRRMDCDNAQEGVAPPATEKVQLALVISDFSTEGEALLALAHASRHLVPGGALLFIEQHRSRWLDFLFGGRPSWWGGASGEDWTSRHKPAQFWRRHLAKFGFQAPAAFSPSGEIQSGPYLLLAQIGATAGAAIDPPPAEVRTWLLVADGEGFSAIFASQLTATLQARGDRVVQLIPGSRFAATDAWHYQADLRDAAQLESFLARLAPTYGRLDGIVYLHGLDPTAADSPPLLRLDRQVDRCAGVQALAAACERTDTRTRVWLVTAHAAAAWLQSHGRQTGPVDAMDAALWGFGRTLMNEASGLEVRLVDIEDTQLLDATTYALSRELAHPDAEREIVLAASGERYVPRLRLQAPPSVPAAGVPESSTVRLAVQMPGQLRNLRWESHPPVPPADDELEIEVRATGLNFRDVMYALGLLSGEAVESGFAGPNLGLEFAGVVTGVGEGISGFVPGDRVVGFGTSSFANRVVARANSVSLIPARLSFEAAATIPSVFFTVHYALNHLARLQEGEKILIHGAAGGVGIAAIQLAKWCGAEIFATAGTEEKRDFLRLLGVDHVFNSRSLAFADEILAVTSGKGVDVVLNSLAGEAINRNLRVLKPFGRFLELGKRDFQENTRIGLRPFRNNISYFVVDADQVMKERPELTAKLFREMMALFGNGTLHPLPYRRFEAEEIIDAFRYMQQSRHIGKIVVTYRNGIHPVEALQVERRRLELPADATYLVTGGLSGFGLKSAQWLAARGARNLVLVSRSGPVTPEAAAALAALRGAGVSVHAAACDICDRKALAGLLSEIAIVLPPLRGIVHAAAVIEDNLIRNMTREQIRRVFAPKILGAQHLHELTLGKELHFFVLFSSATTLFGNPGQGNYVAANSAIEGLAAARRAAGLPALCVGWGAIDDAGFLARNPQIKEQLQNRMGGAAIRAEVALEALEELLLADRSGAGVLELEWRALSRFLPSAGTPKFGELALNAAESVSDEQASPDFRRLLASLSGTELAEAVVGMLRKEVGDILRVPPERIDNDRSLYDMGFDSLMGVELTTAVEARFSVRLPVMALSENPTVARLSARILAQLSGADGAQEEAAAPHPLEQAREIAARHADEEHAEVIARAAEELHNAAEPEQTSRMINNA
jgi:acyl transferase domain-containing protein/NADPH:quinone reductase-like Zn-dependent oxidoreductase/acyl carrier protein